MDNKKRLLLIILVFALLIVGATVLYNKMSAELETEQMSVKEDTAPQQERSLVPDFKVTDIDGNEVQLHSYLGKPIVLNFWASWCGPCQMEMPDFEQAYKEYGDEVNFLMINMTDGSRETVEIASEFIRQNEYTFPVLYDTAREAAYSYAVHSLPVTYFIDADGNAVGWAKGMINAETLEEALNAIMK